MMTGLLNFAVELIEGWRDCRSVEFGYQAAGSKSVRAVVLRVADRLRYRPVGSLCYLFQRAQLLPFPRCFGSNFSPLNCFMNFVGVAWLRKAVDVEPLAFVKDGMAARAK